MNPLASTDRIRLQAVHGWIELGNYREAQKEWLEITPEGREHPNSLKALLHICVHTEQWDYARDVAESLVKLKPDEATSWLSLAHCTRYASGGTVQAAWNILYRRAEQFGGIPNVAYNLACYACQRGDVKAAWNWLERAFDAATDPKAMKIQSLDEPDLEPLWRDISEI